MAQSFSSAPSTFDFKRFLPSYRPVFRYQADRWPYTFFAAYFLLDVFLFASIDNKWLPPLVFALGVLPKAFISSWNHHHQHLATFMSPVLNRFAEVMFGFQTGITSNTWFLHHVRGHHEHYMDQEQDESAWKRKDGTPMGEWEYTAIVAATAYPRANAVGKKFPKARRQFLWMGALHLALIAGAFAYNWYNAIFFVVLPMATSLWITSWITYYHHRGLDTDDHMEASYNITTPFFNWGTGNLGYHTAHHYRQGVHWSKLPELHASIAHKIPAHCYRDGALLSGLIDKRRVKRERKRRRKAIRKGVPVTARPKTAQSAPVVEPSILSKPITGPVSPPSAA